MKLPVVLSLLIQMGVAWFLTEVMSFAGAARPIDVVPQCSSLQDRCNFEDCLCKDEACEKFRLGFQGTVIPVLNPTVTHLQFSRVYLITNPENYDHLFQNAANVTHLSITRTLVKALNPAWFQGFHNLTCLDLSFNFLSEFQILQQVLSIDSLMYFNATETGIFLDSSSALSKTSLIKVIILTVKHYDGDEYSTASWKLISETANLTSLCALPSLQVLRLDGNLLHQTPPVSGCTLRSLSELDLSNNELVDFPVTCSSRIKSLYPSLQKLFLGNNAITILSDNFDICLPEVRFIDLRGNRLPAHIIPSVFYNNYLPNLRTLYLDKQFRPGKQRMWDLNILRFSYLLEDLSIAGFGQDFSSSYMVSVMVFKWSARLRRLNVDGNNFKAVSTERFRNVFAPLTNLMSLSLNGCGLEKINATVFKMFPKLQELYLRDNRLSRIILTDGAFDSVPRLTTLELAGNEIATIGDRTFSVELRERLVAIDLSDNPFVCDCQLLWFRDWLHRDSAKFGDDLERYACANVQLKPITQFAMVQQACLMTRETSERIIFICCFIIITFTLTSLLYRYRWHIRLLLYEVFRGRGEVRRRRLQENNFDYDLFVSYAFQDLPWVHGHLMPELETRLGLRLCIHERDFIPGNNIVDNIARCVESSKKVLVVFSKDFVLSQWCQFELNYCLRHVIDYDDDLLIVCVDDVASREMTTAMMAVLKTTTYIQWAELEEAVDAFWGRVHQALAELFHADHPV